MSKIQMSEQAVKQAASEWHRRMLAAGWTRELYKGQLAYVHPIGARIVGVEMISAWKRQGTTPPPF